MTFLLLELDAVVAVDLADMVKSQFNGAAVVSVDQRSGMRMAIEALPQITAVFVKASQSDVFMTEAIRAARARGATVIQIGRDAVPRFEGLNDFVAVPSPFTNEDIGEALSVIQKNCTDMPRQQA